MFTMSKFVGGCRHLKYEPRCRHVRVQKKIASRMGTTTTRLSESKMPGLSLPDLKSHIDMIKGLFVLPDLRFFPCLDAEPLIVFGKPFVGGQKSDFQHMDLAARLGLTRRRVLSEKEQIIQGSLYGEREFERGVWGFSLSPVLFSRRSGPGGTAIEFPLGNEQTCRIFIDDQRDPGLIDPETGAVDLDRVRNIEEPTAKRLWQHHVFAFLFRSAPQRDKEVWAVSASSGAAGPIPPEVLHLFLITLTRHVAPEFRVFQFNSFAGNYFRKRMRVSWQLAKFPNCLYWPKEMRLLQGPPPQDWWGD